MSIQAMVPLGNLQKVCRSPQGLLMKWLSDLFCQNFGNIVLWAIYITCSVIAFIFFYVRLVCFGLLYFSNLRHLCHELQISASDRVLHF